MIKFSQDKVLLLHQLLIEQTGGEDGVRDFGLLDSALEACYATFDGKELFPSKEEKAARLGVGLVSNHAFVDGNKRIGMYVLLTFLEVNGITIDVTDRKGDKFQYTYDYGDDWQHDIEVLETIEFGSKKPLILEGTGACPKENSR